ncbi:MAG TPA: AAA family ATPase [Symbiobacteriaceae bacterium]|nr:AAA family ATPase [Symbiobacteriaceae bacterium]
MRAQIRRPQRLQEISQWLRRGEIGPAEALNMAMDLRRRQAATGRSEAAAAAAPEPAQVQREHKVRAILAELDGLVGLLSVKRHVREIHAYTSIQLRRKALGLAHEATGLHMVFTGNPGTGKTTVARLLGRLFKEMGVLPSGHMVEVERADLVGEYIGHTAQKTREVVKKATGGVLFIDEAYSLARGGEKDFGKESIDCLVRAMEDYRGELVLILAGYPAEMEWFLAQNPGLRSRFPILVDFPDYTPDELLAIGEAMWKRRQYELTPDARTSLRHLLQNALMTGGDEGNGRAVRNLMERSLRCQALRLVGKADLTKEDLVAVTRADLEQAAREV